MVQTSISERKGYRVWKALDRPSSFFGIRGRFMVLFLLIGAAAALFAISLNVSFGSMMGLVAFGLLLFADYMVIQTLQGKFTEKEFSRLLARKQLPRYIKVHPSITFNSIKGHISWK